MLVLTRKPGEQIIIADNIRITVVSLGPGRVKIGIEAPPDVKVDRQEIREKKQAEDVPAPVIAQAPPVVPTPARVEAPAPVLHNRLVGKLGRHFPPRKPR